MQITHPAPSELPQLKALWQTCFGDSAAYVDHFFARMFFPEEVLVARNENAVIAMMMLLPTTYRTLGASWSGRYVYAVATHPAHRGQGIMTALHQQAVTLATQAGAAFLTLVPATPSLFAMYQKLSYQTCSSLISQSLTVSDYRSQATVTRIAPLSANAFREQRATYLASLPASIALLGPAIDYSYEQITQFGGMILAVKNNCGTGYVVATRTADSATTDNPTLIVRETNLRPLAFHAAVTALGAHTEVRTLLRHLPETVPPRSTATLPAASPYGMIRWLHDHPSTAPPYMNLMLD